MREEQLETGVYGLMSRESDAGGEGAGTRVSGSAQGFAPGGEEDRCLKPGFFMCICL